jgi:hypothetical protein
VSNVNATINMKRLNKLYMEGKPVEELAEIFAFNLTTMFKLIKSERVKNPEKWPKRTRKPKPKPIERTAPVPLAATYLPLPLRGSESSPEIKYTLSREEIEEINRKYPTKKQPTNSDGVPYKEPMVIGSDGRSHA